ncbi:helix-turn-helix domain-containing protein [Clostridium sp. 19966]|uniref:helix-turn-helix domain-containing protein n=1 Tax=Clostridium sp. 19966 TaxID=2768166 RepID=UPI0028DDC80E|nr:helix-turn-helix domain-containing protein [Clostridium sp. 19966]MDT8718820.1 helix-turn-helix domain-containing protein [Clostridium sp. 19966]
MDYSLFIWSVVTFIEQRIKANIDYKELESSTGFSYRHIRETFRQCTNHTLSNYILSRKIANAAFDIIHTYKSITDIAVDYGFESYDTFTRAFKRHTGITPISFRNGSYQVGRRILAVGVYGPAILKKGSNLLLLTEIMEVCINMKDSIKTDNSCILFGVPKVEYCFEEGTPFISSLKSCLNYMGQTIDYAYLMAASGAAFRLRWNLNTWDGGNIDTMCIYEDKFEAFKRSFEAAGREYKLLSREGTDKETFITFIKDQINSGRPVIALGIIGPPEACIITGYDNDGETLLGWNFFQNNSEFAKDIKFHETGYFICDNWWENPSTVGVISIGEDMNQLVSQKDILINGIDIMTNNKVIKIDHYNHNKLEYAGGQAAYDAWAKAIGNDKEFSPKAILPILSERIMCQNDAQCMVGEGRSYAAIFLDWVGKTNEKIERDCSLAANHFRKSANCTFKMNEVKGGFEQNEASIRKFAEPEVREKIVSLIIEAKENEAKACEVLKSIVNKL